MSQISILLIVIMGKQNYTQKTQLMKPKLLIFKQQIYDKNTCLYYLPQYQLDVQQHITEIPFYRICQQEENYLNRYKSSYSLCGIYHIQIIKQQRQKNIISVYTDHFNIQLADVRSLRIKELLNIIQNFIQTLKYLSQEFGYFYFTDKMIGINNHKKWKMWINQNFSLNTPELICPSEQQMIKSVLNVFKEHTETQQRSVLFFTQSQNIKLLNFNKLSEFIKQFSFREFIKIPLFIYKKKSNQEKKQPKIQRNLSRSQIYLHNLGENDCFIMKKQHSRVSQHSKKKMDNSIVLQLSKSNSCISSLLQTNIRLKKSQQMMQSTQASIKNSQNLIKSKLKLMSFVSKTNNPAYQKKSDLSHTKSIIKSSNCWSEFEQNIKGVRLSEDPIKKNNWNCHLKSLNCLLSNKNLKTSIYLDGNEDNRQKLQNLDKLKKLNKYGKKDIYESIVEIQN